MGSFYDDFKKKQNKSQNKPTLIKVPQVAPKSNDRRATAARNREQQRVQAHGGQTQTTQRVNTQQRTTVRQNTEEIGRVAATELIRLIEQPKTTLLEQIVIPGTVEKGKSVAKI